MYVYWRVKTVVCQDTSHVVLQKCTNFSQDLALSTIIIFRNISTLLIDYTAPLHPKDKSYLSLPHKPQTSRPEIYIPEFFLVDIY